MLPNATRLANSAIAATSAILAARIAITRRALLRRRNRLARRGGQGPRREDGHVLRTPHVDDAEALRVLPILPRDRLQGLEARPVLLEIDLRALGGQVEQGLLPHHRPAQVAGAAIVQLLEGERDDEAVLVHRPAER